MKQKKREIVMIWAGVLVLLGVLVAVLFLPLLSGENIGEYYAEAFKDKVNRQYDLNDVDYDEMSEDESEIFEDKAEKEENKIERQIKDIRKFDDEITFFDQFTLFGDYMYYRSDVEKDEVASYRFTLAYNMLIIVAVVAMVSYIIGAVIVLLIKMIKKELTLEAVRKRVGKCLYFLIPLFVVTGGQKYFMMLKHNYGYISEMDIFGKGVMIPCVLVFGYLLFNWFVSLHVNMERVVTRERFVMNRMVILVMLLAASFGILMEFGNIYNSTSMGVQRCNIATIAWNELCENKEYIEELEDEMMEEDADEEYIEERIRDVEKRNKAYTFLIPAGFVFLITTFLSVAIFNSLVNCQYGDEERSSYIVLSCINLVLHFLAILLLVKGYDKIDYDESLDGYLRLGFSMVISCLIQVFIICMGIWKKCINKTLDKKMIVADGSYLSNNTMDMVQTQVQSSMQSTQDQVYASVQPQDEVVTSSMKEESSNNTEVLK